MREHVGAALDAYAHAAHETQARPASDSRRVTIVAAAAAGTWARLDNVRESHAVTWDHIVRAALDAAAAGGDER